ncbi:MAG: hypothetical protein IPK75_19080 [Acidobacteria bacterium]|nr:hypothetical protein [Acidobacteriota bacterium]
MMFTDRFSSFICPGDVITCEAGPFTVLAQVVPDDCPDAPDQRQDGFWPSLYANAPGFIGPGNGLRQRFAEAQARAEAVMEGWRKGDWFYCGIVLSVSLDGVDLAPHAASLWGIEANYPGTNNSYPNKVANELLPEAIAVARETLARLARHADTLERA